MSQKDAQQDDDSMSDGSSGQGPMALKYETVEERFGITRDQMMQMAIMDLTQRVLDWKGHKIEDFGKLMLYDRVPICASHRPSFKLYIVYLFEKLILCCKEKNYSAEELAARGLQAPAPSTADIDKLMKDVLSRQPQSDPEKPEDKPEDIPEETSKEKSEEEPKEQPEEENDPYLFLQGRIFGNSITDIMNFTTEEAYVVEIFWTSDDGKDHYFSMHFEYREDMESWTDALVAMNEMNPTPAQEQADKIVRDKTIKPV